LQGTHEYKFTRGSWSSVETGLNGEYINNRKLQISSNTKLTVDIYIENWDDMKGTHTASGYVYLLESNFPYPQFARTKRIWAYLPPDYFTSPTKTYPVMYMHDGQNLFDKFFYSPGEWNVDEHLEGLYQQLLETSIVVGVETKG
jgi:enterochelin esterase-like enzyme